MPGGNLALAFGALVGGAIVIHYGVEGVKSGSGGSSIATAAGATPSGAQATSTPDVSGGSTATVEGSVQRSTLLSIAKKYGWSVTDVDDWESVIQDESGGNPNIVNPGRTKAYGIGQFVDPSGTVENQLSLNKAKYYTYGGNPNTVTGQLTAMAEYIKQTYGSPAGALQNEQIHHSY